MSPVDRQGGEARNHEAERETVALAVAHNDGYTGPLERHYEQADMILEALDAVRCAQGRDTDAPERSPQGDTEQLVEAATEASKAMRLYNRNGLPWMELDAVFARLDRVLAERSPQGEDHEAEIDREALTRWLARRLKVPEHASAYLADDLIAYLSRRPAPGRLGELLDGETT